MTLSEKIEQLERLASSTPGRTTEEKQTRQNAGAECDRLKRELAKLSEAERAQEKCERRSREKVRSDRLAEFQRFRDETYRLLEEAQQVCYLVGIQDASLKEATIQETIDLPKTPERSTYPPTPVQLTREQLEGYLFLARLGQFGGDPLARSDLVSS